MIADSKTLPKVGIISVLPQILIPTVPQCFLKEAHEDATATRLPLLRLQWPVAGHNNNSGNASSSNLLNGKEERGVRGGMECEGEKCSGVR